RVANVSAPVTVSLSATLDHRTLSSTVTLRPPVFGNRGSMKMLFGSYDQGTAPLSFIGNQSQVGGIVELSAPAPSGGVQVTITVRAPALRVDDGGSDITPAGERDWFPALDILNVTKPVYTTLTAAADGVIVTRQVVIEPGLASITGVPPSLTGGDGFT